jgi:RNA polymerase sigma factor (sigma-70 family)
VQQPTDEELLEALRTDPAAFTQLYDRYVDQIIAIGMRRLASPDLVADLVGDVFLAVIESADRFDATRGAVRPWLYGIAGKLVADTRRRHARAARATERLAGHRFLQPDAYAELEDQLDAAAALRELYTAMAALRPAQRAVLELVALDGLTVAEAAHALGIRPGTARMRLARARRHFERLRPDGLRAAGRGPAPLKADGGTGPPRAAGFANARTRSTEVSS